MLATSLTTEERAVLLAAKQRLGDMRWGASADGAMEELFAAVLNDIDDELPSDWDRSETRRLMGLDPTVKFPSGAEDDGRDYVIGQFRAIDARYWARPEQAIVFACAQTAVHQSLRMAQGQDEPEVSVDLVGHFRSNVEARFIDAMRDEEAYLPAGSFLDIATASMTNTKDRLGADFAIVTGFLESGVAKYRVALFQAKWEHPSRRNRADVWHGKGTQLGELCDTGAGYYVFYPRAYAKGSESRPVFLPTVRSAADVKADADTLPGIASRVVSTCVGRSGEVAWEFGAFLGMALARTEAVEFGRAFGSSDDVARFLAQGRSRPWAHTVLAWDQTPGRSLNLSGFAEELRRHGYDSVTVRQVLNDEDVAGSDDDLRHRPEPRT